MQSNRNIEHLLVQSDWGQPCAETKIDVLQMQEIVAVRMHRYGIVCADAHTLKRASSIVQACSGKRATDDEKRDWAFEVKDMLKRLDKENTWPFEYIRQYPRFPF